ncbi:Oidioi.mRNA.OKI2018_I69.chr2.g4291.t1.cds [Oikopleura dioica]|uniref:Oidioi.mRNA.OKI2018_I69.chr2.g4291.t1.cds n=1 Tax=Oikopleura dioica TaxID=34765 RepID=A0ABN7T2B3_OIKDI|nr:Oidioi.mRNA.OKI2018_I69.chr2.g4291.t1.cds [Oikopleura dioica]
MEQFLKILKSQTKRVKESAEGVTLSDSKEITKVHQKNTIQSVPKGLNLTLTRTKTRERKERRIFVPKEKARNPSVDDFYKTVDLYKTRKILASSTMRLLGEQINAILLYLDRVEPQLYSSYWFKKVQNSLLKPSNSTLKERTNTPLAQIQSEFAADVAGLDEVENVEAKINKRAIEIQSIVPDTVLHDKLQWIRVSLRQRILNTKMALLNLECMLDLEAPMPYDADDVSFDQSQLSSEDYTISFDIHSEALISSTSEMCIE